MAKISENLLVTKGRGNVGKQFIYKKRGNNTHITKMPTVDKKAKASEKQEKVRDLFSAATVFAKGATSVPELRAEYEKKVAPGQTALNVAFKDYVTAPRVRLINTQKYTGNPGSEIVVDAWDDFRVKEVEVSILNAAGELVEKGNAILNPINQNLWKYVVTQLNNVLPGTKISAIVRDIPENEARLELVL